MKPFNEFRNKDASFWAFIKFISETMGYTDRRCSTVKSIQSRSCRSSARNWTCPSTLKRAARTL